MSLKYAICFVSMIFMVSATSHAALRIKPKQEGVEKNDTYYTEKYNDRMGPGKIDGKPITDLSKPHERSAKPVIRNGPCDSHMGGCIDQ